jgi:hypothetical protein
VARGGAKVFGIGLNKTGTRSLADATRLLGYRTLHKGDAETSAAVQAAIAAGDPPLTPFAVRYDAYFDVASLVRNFAVVDAAYPGSKFLLSTRALDAWLDSRERHVLANRQPTGRRTYHGPFVVVDREAWVEEWHAHHAAVREHFADRPDDLLVIDVTAGDGWEVLAPFLHAKVPHDPFPHENAVGLGTYTARDRRARLRRTARRAKAFARRWR